MDSGRHLWSWLGVAVFVLALLAPPSAVLARDVQRCCGPAAPVAGCCDHALMTADCQAICAAALPAPTGPAVTGSDGYPIRFPEASERLRGITHDLEDPPPR